MYVDIKHRLLEGETAEELWVREEWNSTWREEGRGGGGDNMDVFRGSNG